MSVKKIGKVEIVDKNCSVQLLLIPNYGMFCISSVIKAGSHDIGTEEMEKIKKLEKLNPELGGRLIHLTNAWFNKNIKLFNQIMV